MRQIESLTKIRDMSKHSVALIFTGKDGFEQKTQNMTLQQMKEYFPSINSSFYSLF